MFRKCTIAVTAIILAFSFMGRCQDRVIVYQKAGDVKVCSYGSSQWESIAEKDVIGLHDRISIPKEGCVRLLDKGTNRVYQNPQTGNFEVAEVIAAAEKKANDVIGNLNKKISDSKKGTSAIPKYSSYGAVTRGQTTEGGESFADSLYCSVLEFFTAEDISKFIAYEATITKKDDENGLFHFVLQNKGDIDLYTCIIRSDEQGLSISLGPSGEDGEMNVLAAHSEQDRYMHSYVHDGGASDYFLFCSTVPFNPIALNDKLKAFPSPGASGPASGVSFAVAL